MNQILTLDGECHGEGEEGEEESVEPLLQVEEFDRRQAAAVAVLSLGVSHRRNCRPLLM